MNSLIHKTTTPFGKLVIAVLFLMASAVISMPGATHADNGDVSQQGRLITIHDRGTEKVILSQATTISDALKEANITIDSKDVVEPAMNETLIASDYQVNIYRARPVIIVDGNVRKKIITPYQTAEQITADAGVTLYPEDETTIDQVNNLADGAGVLLTITRATPFSFTLYGKTAIVRTRKQTVGEMLTEKGVKLAVDDRISLATDTKITEGLAVRVWREGKQTITVDEDINFEVEKIKDVDQDIGYREIKTPGEKGSRSVTYEILIQDGQEVSRTEISGLITKQPKKQIEIIGAKLSFGGDFSEALTKLRACESGGNYANKRNPLYRGAYQFNYSTWGNRFGVYDPADATPAQQDQAARDTYVRRGWQPWPVCGARLPDAYR